ncbi:NAD-dependent epimerase/dehydratase family protein [Nocardia mangyaensis]|uniref:NAD-dependent epimerase/dehydratase family protein n=1 Tax=Nocardia mangyaensis TaxID=2213200 RepID=UPI00267655FE|nr:NAD-dependent epimerase/dehydratase family protein [Nocardia mangyaensis]MDO3647792.1 NAD-dependent epimerase [Nocardia mangyaensis]
MSLHVVVGAGPVGSATALLLAERGERVRLLTRSGSGPAHDRIERIAADAADADALTRHATGAVALYCCAGPPYGRWVADWPPLGAAFLRAAEATGAIYVATSNLYGYGPVEGPMTEDMPMRATTTKGRVRARLWEEALAAHRAGRVRAAEVRGSDYLGAGAVTPLSVLVLPKVLAGHRVSVPAALDVAHSWTYVGDVARTLVAVAASPSHLGRPWHVPTPPPRSVRAMAERIAELSGAPQARIRSMPAAALRLAGCFDRNAKEMVEVQYQLRHPFVLDSSAATDAFGIAPTPTDDALREMIAAERAGAVERS